MGRVGDNGAHTGGDGDKNRVRFGWSPGGLNFETPRLQVS